MYAWIFYDVHSIVQQNEYQSSTDTQSYSMSHSLFFFLFLCSFVAMARRLGQIICVNIFLYNVLKWLKIPYYQAKYTLKTHVIIILHHKYSTFSSNLVVYLVPNSFSCSLSVKHHLNAHDFN